MNSHLIVTALVALLAVAGCRKEEEVKAEPLAPDAPAAVQAPVKVVAQAQGQTQTVTVQKAVAVRAGGTHVAVAAGAAKIIRADDGREIRAVGDRVELTAPDGRKLTMGPNGMLAEDRARGVQVTAQ